VELRYQSDSSLNGTLPATFEQPADLPVFPVCKSTDYGRSWTRISSIADTGARPGTAVPQLYLSDPIATVTRPVRQLIGFARVELGRVNAARSGSTRTRT
jgi:hypothetical protein